MHHKWGAALNRSILVRPFSWNNLWAGITWRKKSVVCLWVPRFKNFNVIAPKHFLKRNILIMSIRTVFPSVVASHPLNMVITFVMRYY